MFDDVAGITYHKDQNFICNSYGAIIKHIESEHINIVLTTNAPWTINEKINDLIDELKKLLIKELHLPDTDSFAVNYYKKRHQRILN